MPIMLTTYSTSRIIVTKYRGDSQSDYVIVRVLHMKLDWYVLVYPA